MLIDVTPLQTRPTPNVGSQIERAIIALLKAFFNANAALGLPAMNFYFSNDWKERDLPLIDVLAHKSVESIAHTRNESYQVRVEVKWPGSNQPGQTDQDMNWKMINDIIGVVMAALSQTQIDTTLNAGEPQIPVEVSALPRVTGKLVTQAGRALAVDGSNGADQLQAQDALNNADMVNFTCDYVQFKGSQRAESDGQSVLIREIRNFEVRACPSNVD